MGVTFIPLLFPPNFSPPASHSSSTPPLTRHCVRGGVGLGWLRLRLARRVFFRLYADVVRDAVNVVDDNSIASRSR